MRVYADPIKGKESSIGEQIVTAYFERKAVEEAAPEQYFTQLASVKMMPKNSGKTIERYVHIPLLLLLLFLLIFAHRLISFCLFYY